MRIRGVSLRCVLSQIAPTYTWCHYVYIYTAMSILMLACGS